MGKRAPLYRETSRKRTARAALELGRDALALTYPGGRWYQLQLSGARFRARDARARQRFVRHLCIWRENERIDIITPPEHGAIAPRAVSLPYVPNGAAVVESGEWQALFRWLDSGGRLGSHTMDELSQLSCLAGIDLAADIGRQVAALATEMYTCRRYGPMRSRVGDPLAELRRTAATSERARVACLAAEMLLEA